MEYDHTIPPLNASGRLRSALDTELPLTRKGPWADGSGRLRPAGCATYGSNFQPFGENRVPAPRRYTDEQRAVMLALYDGGHKPAEIARRCKAGLVSVAPFKIPRRTVQEIVTAMARERGLSPPRTLAETETAQSLERYPDLVIRILTEDARRILSEETPTHEKEYDRLQRGVKIAAEIKRQRLPLPPPRSEMLVGRCEPRKTNGTAEPTLERLAREARSSKDEKNQGEAGDTPAVTHTPERELEGAAR